MRRAVWLCSSFWLAFTLTLLLCFMFGAAHAQTYQVPIPASTVPVTINVPSGCSTGQASSVFTVQCGGPPPGLTLLEQLKAMPVGQALTGVTTNIFSSTPTNMWSPVTFTGSNWAALTVTDGNGVNTGQLPAIVNVFANPTAPYAMYWINEACSAPDTCPAPFNPPPNDWLTTAKVAQGSHEIVDVLVQCPNPAGASGFTSPWPAVTQSGSTVQATYLACIDRLSTQVKELSSYPIIIALFAEANLANCWGADANGNHSPGLWATINCPGNTAANMKIVWDMTVGELRKNGVTGALLMCEPNAGVGNYAFACPDPAETDLVSLDSASPTVGSDPAAYAYMQSLNMPMGYGSLIPMAPGGNPGKNTINLGQFITQLMALYPKFGFYILWGQGVAFQNQTNAQAAMQKPFWPLSQVPLLTGAGGFLGG